MVALDDGIGVAGNDARGVGQRFTFFGAGVGAVGKADYLTAQTLHGGFEGEPCARGWLEKHELIQLAFEQLAARLGFELEGSVQHELELLGGEIGNGNHMLPVERVGHGISFFGFRKKARLHGLF